VKAKVVKGFDYRVQREREQTFREWIVELVKVEIAGGYQRRIGGDLTAFDKSGKIMFEIYDGGLQR
jgi:hypothetical protein